MPLLRPKQPVIYDTVSNWWNNQGGVSYIAHAVRNANVVPLGAATQGDGGGTPVNHPDQVFWRNAANNLPAAATVLRIEIDCSLMPCDSLKGNSCCLYMVPQLITAVGYANKPLRIFSHRDEHMGASPVQNKRMFSCNSNDNRQTLDAAFNQHQNWFWASPTDPRVGNGAYHLF